MTSVERLFLTLANAFPVWVIVGAALALLEPQTALWFQPTWIPFFLSVIMLSMGLTLNWNDFKQALKAPRLLALGVGLQYIVMPALGLSVSLLFHLPVDYMIGIVLVACCPGGTASNVVCFIARANVALSVSLTTVSTVLAVILTPLLTTLLIEPLSKELSGVSVQVDTWSLLVDTFQVVIVPVAAGILLNRYFHRAVRKINPYTPLLAVLSIVFIVDFILAAKKDAIIETGATLLFAVLTLHILGFILGFVLTRAMGYQRCDAQTVSIEVGMQNSGLATELARSNFPAFGMATVPGAISALSHCILGSIVAGLCRWVEAKEKRRNEKFEGLEEL
ncbi:MAG: bile acid:sodium symporter family protein [Candidatus Nitrohelix vancouverensis]|uniref:Bile acid:sodium symporter family protein n=1 Tax=Candidatus Nitrohelix vancouverensis TaxID=2705534 RepID=A0A7T0BZV7_9BACT|nr:MAG: bile acid:sodium symporter family protein [Candidatus Nitrohelix vancouverensis]